MITRIFKGLAPVFAVAAATGLSGCNGNISINDKEGVPLAELDLAGNSPTELVVAGPDKVIVAEGETLAIDVSGDQDAVDRAGVAGGQVEDRARKLHQTRPVTGISAPVMARLSGEARNSMTRARSAGWTHFAGSASGMSVRFWSVSRIDGRTALTVTEVDFSSSARLSVKRCTPALDAA